MEVESLNPNHLSDSIRRLLPSVGPVILVTLGYVDPGKWAATIEGGARFGYDLLLPMAIFSFVAILCQYLSARISVVTGRDLVQICSAEYEKYTCMFLGVQTAVSVIALDLTMIIGIAHGLNLLLGVDLSIGVFLTAVHAVLLPIFASFLEKCKANFLCTCIAGCILLFYFLGVLNSQAEVTLSMNGALPNLSVESAFALMSLLGANIMPHNFYLHSSFVLHQGAENVSKDALCHHHFLAILCMFSGIYLVNYVLMSSAANVFNSTGLVLLTFSDAMSLMEQVFRNPVALLAFMIILYITNQLTRNLAAQVVLRDFLRLDIPNWLQLATIRVMAIVPALCCLWTSGVEGVYQLLIFTQVITALVLPSSLIPLFRVASSRPLMGVYKISPMLEFLALVTFMGLLGLKIIFVVEMFFGNSDWVSNLRWNVGSSASVPYITLLIIACCSFSLMLWLAATPLKSATLLDAEAWNWNMPNVPKLSTQEEQNFMSKTRHDGGKHIENPEQLIAPVNTVENYSDRAVRNSDLDFLEPILDTERELHLTTIVENHSGVKFHNHPKSDQMEPFPTIDKVSLSTIVDKVADVDVQNNPKVHVEPVRSNLKIHAEQIDPIEKTLEIEGDSQVEKENSEGDACELQESAKVAPGSLSSLALDGPPSFKNLNGKTDECGSGGGSLSRLAGLGRAARRQLTSVLDEFWGQVYDFHGRPTQEAMNKKLALLLGGAKLVSSSMSLETTGKDFSGFFQPVSGWSDSLINTSLCDSPTQVEVHSSIDSSYGIQRGASSLWSSHLQLLDAYVQSSGLNVVDSSEKRYSSMRTLPSSEGWDNQPATIHGYQIASIVNGLAKDRKFSSLNGLSDSPGRISPSVGSRSYKDPHAVSIGQKLQNGLISNQAAGYQNFPASGNSPLQSLQPCYAACSPGSVENNGMSANTKKYHSLPDISGISGRYRDLYMSEKTTQWDNNAGYGASAGRATLDRSFYSTNGSGIGALAFNSISKGYSSSDYGSIWAKQPYEQFGIADKYRTVGSGLGSRSDSITSETTSVVDSEAQILQSFRCCILKLLKLEGSDWLFAQNDGADEDLIERVAARERCLCEVEKREINCMVQTSETQYHSNRKSCSPLRNDEAGRTNIPVSSVPNCGEGCVWKADLIISFGVWCIHRILDLSLMESRPELWGKYTYVLNRLQGILGPAFSKPRTPMAPCFCLQLSAAYQRKLSPPITNGMLPPAAKPGRGKVTTAVMVIDLIKDVEIAISCRKGRSGTAAGDVAFPKGKENLASVLKRLKRRLSNKPTGGK